MRKEMTIAESFGYEGADLAKHSHAGNGLSICINRTIGNIEPHLVLPQGQWG